MEMSHVQRSLMLGCAYATFTWSASTVSIGFNGRCDTLVLPEGLYHRTNRETVVAHVFRLLTRGVCRQSRESTPCQEASSLVKVLGTTVAAAEVSDLKLDASPPSL